MTSDWCYKCPRCGEIIELEGEELNHGDGDETELECYECGQKIKCVAEVSIDYQFSVKNPDTDDEYNVGVALLYKSGTDPSRPENYTAYLEDEDEWNEIHEILAGQNEDDDDLKTIADIKKDPNWRDKCIDWDAFFKTMLESKQ